MAELQAFLEEFFATINYIITEVEAIVARFTK